MSEETYFGVGCFHFWLKKKAPFNFDLDTYIKSLDETLQRIPTITNIEIEHVEATGAYEISSDFRTLLQGEEFLPHPSFLEIQFDVYIPFRIQEKLYEGEFPPDVFTENFAVKIQYAYHAPVCFVHPIKPSEEVGASDCVRLVRDYLRFEINNLKADITFDSLGPSPFHADFRLSERDSEGMSQNREIFKAVYNVNPGYDDIVISYPKGAFESLDEARTAFYAVVADEFGLFYQIQLCEVQAMNLWEAIDKMASEVVELERKQKLIKTVKDAIFRGRHINRLFTKLVLFESAQLSTQSFINKACREVYSDNLQTFIKAYIDDELIKLPTYPSKQIGELVMFLENRRGRSIEMIVVLLSAFLGGIAGSIITILISGLSSD